MALELAGPKRAEARCIAVLSTETSVSNQSSRRLDSSAQLTKTRIEVLHRLKSFAGNFKLTLKLGGVNEPRIVECC